MEFDKKKILLLGLAVETLITFCFTITSFVVATTANAGFNVVLTGLLYLAYCGGTYYVIQRSHTPLAVGFLIGATGSMTFLSLQTAVYWGQLSKCEDIHGSVDQYSCDNTHAYGAVAAFASLMLIFLLISTVLLVLWREQLIGDTVGLYEEIGGSHPGAGAPYDPAVATPYNQGAEAYNQKQPSTADL